MTSLAEKEGLKGKVQTIYLDPPYGIKFGSNWQVSTRKRDVKDGKAEDATRQPAKMNPDLAMGDELLKKTGAGNLFMVFGEPDVEIRKIDPPGSPTSTAPSPQSSPGKRGQGEGKKYLQSSAKSAKSQAADQFVVEIKGVDVYDPTTGQIRSASTDDIACWFIDTDYNGESFFVRHAYFTGAEKPYDKLKRALRAEIDEAAWSSLYSTTSRPFNKPGSGKIAVKVINHYGDEVLKVFDV